VKEQNSGSILNRLEGLIAVMLIVLLCDEFILL